MSDINSTKKSDVICHCSGTTERQIKALISEGIDTLDGISGMTGACSGCGSCDIALLELLAKKNIADLGV